MTDRSRTYRTLGLTPGVAGRTTSAPYNGPNDDDSVVEETGPVTLRVTQSLSLPMDGRSHTRQHVVLTRDGSSSMSGSKIRELQAASAALCSELAAPPNRDGFVVSVVDFSSGAEIRASAQPATRLNLPKAHANGGTNFEAAILKTIEAIAALDDQPNEEGWRYLRPHVLFLSDGHSNVSDRNIAALHELAGVTTIAYGADAAQNTLARIASDGRAHVVGTSGTELRRFLAEVGKTLSQSLATAR